MLKLFQFFFFEISWLFTRNTFLFLPSDASTENLKYLTLQNALADIAYFITEMNRIHSLPEDTKWILFGGSYPGYLAAWARLKYPHLVSAAVASGAPLLAVADYYRNYLSYTSVTWVAKLWKSSVLCSPRKNSRLPDTLCKGAMGKIKITTRWTILTLMVRNYFPIWIVRIFL